MVMSRDPYELSILGTEDKTSLLGNINHGKHLFPRQETCELCHCLRLLEVTCPPQVLPSPWLPLSQTPLSPRYGGFVLDTNILVQQNLAQLRSGNFSALTFPDKEALKGQNETFALSKGTILAASPGAPLLTRLLTLATTTMTEGEFPSRIDDMVKEVLANKTEELEGGLAVRLEGDQLKITPALAKGATEGVAGQLEMAWTGRNTSQAQSG